MNPLALFLLVTLYNNQCEQVQTLKAGTVVLAPESKGIIELPDGKLAEFDLSDIKSVEVQLGKVDKFFINVNGNWIEAESSGCGRI